jgi:hypothetical protein
MADVDWPRLTFVPRTPEVRLAGETVGGGRSLTGKMMPVAADSGYWLITLGNIPIRTRGEVLAWEAIAAQLEGRRGTINVPIYQSKRSPWPAGVPGAAILATMQNAIAAGATSCIIAMTIGADPEAGMFFSTGERLYQIRTATPTSGDLWAITFRPTARQAVSDGDSLEFAHPICRCRLVADDGMGLALDLQRFANATLYVEEDV